MIGMAEQYEDKGSQRSDQQLAGRYVAEPGFVQKLHAASQRVQGGENPREANRAQAAAAVENKVVQLNQKMEKKEKELSERIEILNMEKEQKQLQKEMQDMCEHYRSEVELSDKVKRRVALTEARKRALRDIGKAQGKNETQFEYFETVSLDDHLQNREAWIITFKFACQPEEADEFFDDEFQHLQVQSI